MLEVYVEDNYYARFENSQLSLIQTFKCKLNVHSSYWSVKSRSRSLFQKSGKQEGLILTAITVAEKSNVDC